MVLRRLGGRDLTLTVLVSFGFAIILEGLQGILWSSSFQAINTAYSLNSFEIGGIYVPLVRLMAAGAALVLLGALFVILRAHQPGSRDPGDDPGPAHAPRWWASTWST